VSLQGTQSRVQKRRDRAVARRRQQNQTLHDAAAQDTVGQ
jgi:hypothetical protein